MSHRLHRTADGSPTLADPSHGALYRSRHGAVTESRHVFLSASGAGARARGGRSTRILELGLGAGLNMLLTADAFHAAGTPLDYVGIERSPVPAAVRSELGYGKYLAAPELAARWEQAEPVMDGNQTVALAESIDLTVWQGDATALARRDPASLPGPFDIVYLDAFGPRTNPEPWQTDVLAWLHGRLAPGGVLATYCAQGAFRRALAAVGFAVEVRPGPPGKREMTRAWKGVAPGHGGAPASGASSGDEAEG